MIITRPNIVLTLGAILTSIGENISTKFREFYVRRLVEAGLVLKNFYYTFDVSEPGSSTHRRSVTKLKAILLKQLQKLNPQILFAENEFIVMGTSDYFLLKAYETDYLKVPPEVKDMEKYKADLRNSVPGIGPRGLVVPTLDLLRAHGNILNVYIRHVPEFKSYVRYARFFNYQARKNNIPLCASASLSIKPMDSNNRESCKLEVNFSFEYMPWVCVRDEDIERYVAVQKGAVDDSLFARDSVWAPSSNLSADRHKLFNKYHMSKIFLHIDKSSKLLTTLSRKINYGFSAFDFRSI